MRTQRQFKLLVDLPFLEKGSVFLMDDETDEIFWYDKKGNLSEYGLRPALSGYLWLLCTERKFMKLIKTTYL